ncbi:MAG: hypothetical protein AB8G11_07635 [Saprospiraceae bacterium]
MKRYSKSISIENKKYLEKTFNEIEILKSSKDIVLYKEGDDDKIIDGKLFYDKKKGFSIEIYDVHVLDEEDLKEIYFKNEQQKYKLSQAYISNRSVNLDIKNNKGLMRCVIRFAHFSNVTIKNQKKHFIRTILETKFSFPQLCFICETIKYDIENTTYAFKCLRVNVGNNSYDIYHYKDKKNNKSYIILENLTPVSQDDYFEARSVIFTMYDFITGLNLGGKSYCIYSDNKNFEDDLLLEFMILRDEWQHYYTPICTNPYTCMIKEEDLNEEEKSNIKRLTLVELNRFCELMNNDSDFRYTISLINEACNASLNIMPSSLAVALESLTNYLQVESEELIYPIKNNFKDEFINSILEYAEKNLNQFVDKNKIINRLRNINQPINRKHLKNEDKLRLPFIDLGIPLNNEDLETLKIRNDLMHGNFSLQNKEKSLSTNELNKRTHYFSSRLLFLNWALILRTIGYDGNILNYAKKFESYFGKPIEENFYRAIK